jgi:hypothetical protein
VRLARHQFEELSKVCLRADDTIPVAPKSSGAFLVLVVEEEASSF